MANEELVPRIEYIEDSRKLLKDLKDSTANIRLFLQEGDKNRYNSMIPHKTDMIIKVSADIDYDPFSSIAEKTIPKSRKEIAIPSISVYMAPKFEDQRLTYYWNKSNLPRKTRLTKILECFGVSISNKHLGVWDFGGDDTCIGVTLSNGVHYTLFPKLRDVPDHSPFFNKKLFNERATEFNLSEFGWENY